VTLGEVLRRATGYLAEKGVESPRLDAEYLLAKALSRSRIDLYLEHDRPLTEEERAAYRKLIERRGKREPLAYILGEWGFRRLTLRVDPRALVPRPETEIVVERCLALLNGVPGPEVLDVGTGTGAIALAIADEHPGARVTGFDNSSEALSLAQQNLSASGFEDRVRLVEHDLTSGFGSEAFDLVVSNPPYVAEDEIASLPPEVRDWEPRAALVEEGATEKVALAALEALRRGGFLVLETAAGKSDEVALLLEGLGYDEVRITPDLAGRQRVVEGRKP
jgi:release factor glutamine methyltransferase